MASAVVVFIRQQLDTIAVLRCLGASAGRVLRDLPARGRGDGTRRQRRRRGARACWRSGCCPGSWRDSCRWTSQPVLSPRAVALGLGMGLWVALVFALLPLLAVRRVPPLAALRRDVEPEPPAARSAGGWPRPRRWPRSASSRSPALQVGSWRQGAVFSGWRGGRAAGALGRVVGARSAPRAAGCPPAGRTSGARASPTCTGRPTRRSPSCWRSASAPSCSGRCSWCSTTCSGTLRMTGGPARPNLVLFDIQPDQLPTVQRELAAAGYRALGPVPIVPMRIQSIKGRPVLIARADTARRRGRRRARPAERLGASPRVPLDLSRHAGGLRAAGRGPLVDAGARVPTADLRRARPGPRARRRRRRRDRLGRAGRAARHPRGQPARGGLGPLRAQLLRRVRAGALETAPQTL